MARKSLLGKPREGICQPRLDRVLFGGSLVNDMPPKLLDYQIESDHFVYAQTKLHAYRRLRNLKNRKTKAIVGIQYGCVCPWLPEAKVTLTAREQHELLFCELEQLFAAFEKPRLLQFELALDFPPASLVDRSLVRAHGRFGKAQPVGGNLYQTLNYGGRHSHSFARCYEKPELECYRIEVQVHSGWLRKNNIRKPDDICRAADQILDSRFSFVRLDFERLHAYFAKTKGRPAADKIIEQVRVRSHVLHRALRYLRRDVGLQNAHRFLRPLKRINREIRMAVCVWQHQWGCCDGR